MKPAPDRDRALAAIARESLSVESLETRRSDALDFSEQAVWSLRQALESAYEAGRAARVGEGEPRADVERMRRGCFVLGVSDVEHFIPPGWVVIERDDEAAVFASDEAAACWLISSVDEPCQGLWVDAQTGELAPLAPGSDAWAQGRTLRLLVPVWVARRAGLLEASTACPLCGDGAAHGCLLRCPSTAARCRQQHG